MKNQYQRFLGFSVPGIGLHFWNYNKEKVKKKDGRKNDEREKILESFASRSASLSLVNHSKVDAIAY